MCIICIEYIKGRLSPSEVRRAAQELVYYSKESEQEHAANILFTKNEEELDELIEKLNKEDV